MVFKFLGFLGLYCATQICIARRPYLLLQRGWLAGWLRGWVAVCYSRYCIKTTKPIDLLLFSSQKLD